MTLQERPICFECDERIESNSDMVFEAPCGHPQHASVVFHGVCLMAYRDKRAAFSEYLKRMRDKFIDEHGYDPEEESEAS